MASNGRFLAVVQPVRLENTGWEIKVRDNNDFSTLIAIVYEWMEFSISPALNDSGTGSITVDLDTPYWHGTLDNGRSTRTLLDYEYLWEAWENGTLRFQWLGRSIEENRISDDETRQVTISGPGTAETLRMAKILRPGWPKAVPKKVLNNPDYGSGSNDKPAYKWIFPPKWPVMRMWYTLLKAAQKRKAAPWIKPTFSATKDSGGANWVYVPTVATVTGNGFSPTLGMDLLDFLNDCTGQDYSTYFAEYCEWVMWPNFKLDVRPVIGAHREKKVIFTEGNIQDRQRTRSREEIGNVVIVIDNTGRDSTVSDAKSIKRWNRREHWYGEAPGTLTIAARRTAVARNVLRQFKDEKSEWTLTVPAFATYRRPFYDYNVGDWIGVSNWHSTTANNVDAYRVLAITVTVADETPTVELTLQSELQYRLAQLQKQLTWIINKVTKNPQDPVDDDPTTTTSGTGNATFGANGYADGIRMFIQANDPGNKLARPGDLWFDTSYTADEAAYIYDPPADDEVEKWPGYNPYTDTQIVYDNLNPNVTGDPTPDGAGNLNPNVAGGGVTPPGS